MDFRSLSYFMTVASELNITRAAEKLNMSQPPLSNQIRNLEEELGCELFIRSKKGLQLTDAGNVLVRRAAQIMNLADKTKEELAALSGELSGTLIIGMVEGHAPFLAARWINDFMERYPGVRYELWNGSSDDVLEQLDRNLVDLAVIAAPYDTYKLEGFTVGREPWVAVMSSSHPLAYYPGDTVPLEKLVGHPLIIPRRKTRVGAIRRWFASIGAEANIVCEHSNYVHAQALAQADVGICIWPQTTEYNLPGVVSKVITDPPKLAEYYLVWNRDMPRSEIAATFADFVSEYIKVFGIEGLSVLPNSEAL